MVLSFFPFRFPPFYRWRGFRFVGVVDSHSRFTFSPLFYSSRKAGGWRIFSSAKRNLIDLERHREVESIPIYGKVSWKHASKERGDTITKWSRSSGGRKEPHAQQPSQALFRPTGEPCHQFTASDVSLACSIQGNRCELYKPVT